MHEFPSDIASRIESFVTSGYASAEEVLREALEALECRDSDLTAIREGIADEEAGRLEPARSALTTLRIKHGLGSLEIGGP